MADRPGGRGGGGLIRREMWKTWVFLLWGTLGLYWRVGGRYHCSWKVLGEVEVEAIRGRTNLRFIFRPQDPLFRSHKIFSPGDGHLLVLETSSERCRGVEEYCRMLYAASGLGLGGHETELGNFGRK